MSGGFFRGTSADQDTRFSNKQAKLLKSQKFPPELDHPVDMTKVKMDVMKPWIAKRVTEFLGFEDEVLINFIYGLLDVKDVNGKEVQISLTGFMEKNTGKFMKELWGLLLSAQKNTSGVPQQFLDAKEEETKKKKAESDRIANEIKNKKEREIRDSEQEKTKKQDGCADGSNAATVSMEKNSKQTLPRTSSGQIENEKETAGRNGSRGWSRLSTPPYAADHSPSLAGGKYRSRSKSFSNSRSNSMERLKSRSISRSPSPRGRSTSSERVRHSRQRRSLTPRRKDLRRHSPRGPISPLRRTSSHYRRRSTSRSYRMSRSPIRRRPRSPFRRRSPSPPRRKSPSLMRRRSPSLVRYRSPRLRRRSPPIRRRSPVFLHHRSPSPPWRGSPSPMRRRSPSPIRRRRRRSSSTPRSQSPMPIRHISPIYGHRRSPSSSQHGSPSPNGWSSGSPVRHRPSSIVMRKSPSHKEASSVPTPQQKRRTHGEQSSLHHSPLREKADHVQVRKGVESMAHRSLTKRAPQSDFKDQRNSPKKVPSSSPSHSDSPHLMRRTSNDYQWPSSPHKSPVKQVREQVKSIEPTHHHRSPVTSEENEGSVSARERFVKPNPLQRHHAPDDSPVKIHYKEKLSPERLADHPTTDYTDKVGLRRKDRETKSEMPSEMAGSSEVSGQQKYPSKLKRKNTNEGYEVKDNNRNHNYDILMATEEAGYKNQNVESASEESDRHRTKVKGRRKHKRSYRNEGSSDDDGSSYSEMDDRKLSKRRRRHEKRLRKEEKRLRREERRHKREERRAVKLEGKSRENVLTASGSEKSQTIVDGFDGECGERRDCHSRDAQVNESSEQKMLEIELRKKALESLRAKKGIDH